MIVKVSVAGVDVSSVAVTVTVEAPATVGVPEIVEVAASKVRPSGSPSTLTVTGWPSGSVAVTVMGAIAVPWSVVTSAIGSTTGLSSTSVTETPTSASAESVPSEARTVSV